MDGESEAVWAETADGGLLRDLFGHWPTMRDAAIRSLDIGRASDTVEMVVDYQDRPEGSERGLKVRVRLRWGGVRSLDLPLYSEELAGLEFRRADEGILTALGSFDGSEGRILAETLEAELVQVDPGPEGDAFGAVRLTYR